MRRADGIRADHHAFDNLVRHAFEQGTIHERPGIAFVGVANDIFLVAGRLAAKAPLHAGREAGAAATAQAGLAHFVNHLFGFQRTERLGHGSVGAPSNRIVDALRIEPAAVAKHVALLRPVEGNQIGSRGHLCIEALAEPLDGLSAPDRNLDDLVDVARFHAAIEEVVGLDHDNRRQDTLAVATHIDDGHFLLQAGGRHLRAKLPGHFRGA